jgi:hypothetical protein
MWVPRLANKVKIEAHAVTIITIITLDSETDPA